MSIARDCEYPKVGPHAAEMRRLMADILFADRKIRVFGQGNHFETFGFYRRGEGIVLHGHSNIGET